MSTVTTKVGYHLALCLKHTSCVKTQDVTVCANGVSLAPYQLGCFRAKWHRCDKRKVIYPKKDLCTCIWCSGSRMRVILFLRGQPAVSETVLVVKLGEDAIGI